MKKSISSLGKIIKTSEQKKINGGSAHYVCTKFLYIGASCNQGSGVCILPFPGSTYLECSTDNPFLDM